MRSTESAFTDEPGPQPTARERRKQATRARILAAAYEVFASQGFTRASVEDILVRAGVSRATFYAYFANKVEVLVSLWESAVQNTTDLPRAFVSESSPSLLDVRRWVESCVAMYDRNLPVMRAWMEAEASEPGLARRAAAGFEQVAEALAGAIATARGGVLRPGEDEELRLRAVLLLFQVERFCYFTLIHGWPVERETGVAMIAKSWYEAIYADV